MSTDFSGFSLYELFRAEAETQLSLLTEGLLQLETTGASAAAVEPLMRAAHSLKGAARIVGMAAAEQLAHALEDVFVAAQHAKITLSSSHVDVLLGSVDLLGEVSRIAEGTVAEWLAVHGARLAAQISTLAQIQHGTGVPPTSAPEVPPVVSPEQPTPTAPVAADLGPSPAPAVPAMPAPSAAGTAERPEPRPASPDTAPQTGSETPERVVRVTAENLNRLLGLAGESLVQARQLRPLVDSLQELKQAQVQLWDVLHAVDDGLLALPHPLAAKPRENLLAAKHHLAHSLETIGQRVRRLEDHARRGEDLSERLHHEVISSRLRPLMDGVRGFPRLVRDTARELGKLVRFEILGEQTGVDRDILEKLEAPLNHLIRNALDHGIELPDARRDAGKPETATISLEARHVAGMLQIRLSDDGRGIDPERIRCKVVERGLATPAWAEKMTVPELLEFLFLPGFTTKTEVTSLSGRGVGLDVVQSMVQSVGGSVRVQSQLGTGSCFLLQLPITMSVIRALLVRISGQPYAFPLSRLERIQRVAPDEIETIEGRPFCTMDGQALGLVSASQVLELPAADVAGRELPVAVISDRGHRFGVIVDAFLGERDLDVRPLDARLGKVPNISSASVLEDGWPVLIIDVEDLVRSIDNLLHGRRFHLPALAADTEGAARKAKRVLVVDDSITVRELERQLLESRGYLVDVAVDGMDGWNAARGGAYDLIVSDVDMPRMDGIQLVSLLKQDPRLRAVPVVIVSYKDREEDRMRGLDVGASCYLTKSSFHDDTFLEAVADLIGEAVE